MVSILAMTSWMPSVTALVLGAASLGAVEITLTFTAPPPEAVAVWYEGRTGRLPATVTVDQVERTFTPAVVIAAPGATLEIRNSDTQQHNVFALDGRLKQDVDLGLGAPGSLLTRAVDWPAGEVLRHGCKIHPDMRLWVVCTTSPEAVGQRLERGKRTVVLHLPGDPGPVRLWAPRLDPLVLAPGATLPLTLAGRPIGTAHADGP